MRRSRFGAGDAGRVGGAVFLGALLTGVATEARADDNAAVVEQLFADGKKLVAAGRIAEACPKFLASYNLEHRVGTLLNLADCYEQNHQIASAWGRFIEARTLAARNNQAERADYASTHAAALEPRRSMLTIVGDASVPGLVVKRDGVVVDPAVFGVAVPIDGGAHTVDVTATGKVPVSASLAVAPEGDQKTYTVPSLVAGTAPSPEPSAPSKGGISTRAIAGIAVAGAGVVLAGVGIGFGVAALGAKSDSNAFCGKDGNANDCFGAGVGDRSTAVTDATLSSVLIGVGAAAAVGGVVIWLTAPASKAAATVGFDGHVLRLAGTF